MRLGNRYIDIRQILVNLKRRNTYFVSYDDIKELEKLYIDCDDIKLYDLIAEILGMYYAQTDNLIRAISISELFVSHHKIYASTLFDYFIEEKHSDNDIKKYESLDYQFVHEALISYYYEYGQNIKAREQAKKVKELRNVDATENLCNAYLEAEEYDKAFELAKKMYDYDYSGALANILGFLYFYGYGVLENKELALKYFEEGSLKNNSSCYYWLGYMYGNGDGVEKDDEKAICFYEKAYNLGSDSAKEQIALIYHNKGDYEKAFKIFSEILKSDTLKDGESCYYLGKMYFYGKGTKKDYIKALKYFQEAYDKDCDWSIVYLGYLYSSNLAVKDVEKAINYYNIGIERGSFEFYRGLAHIYTDYTSDYLDFDKALECYKKILDNRDEVNSDCFNASVFEYFYLLAQGYGRESDLENYSAYIDKLIKEADEDTDISLLLLVKNKIDYHLGKVDKLDFNIIVNRALLDYDDPNNRLNTIKEKLESNSPIIIIDSINELTDEFMSSIPKNSLIFTRKYDSIETFGCNDLYTYDEMVQILSELKDIVSSIDLNQSEEDIFMQVCIKVMEKVKRIEATELYKTVSEMHNLCSLITKEAVCMGFSYILYTVFEMLGMDCELINAFNHQFVQTKVNGKWYYSDMSFMIKKGSLDYCLRSYDDMCTDSIHIPSKFSNTHEANESYKNMTELYKKNLIKLYGDSYLEHDYLNILGYVKKKEI